MKHLILTLLLVISSFAQQQNREFFVDVCSGAIYQQTCVTKFANSALIGVAEETIWDGGVPYVGNITDSSLIDVVSSSALDDSGAYGAWTVEFTGLGGQGDYDWRFQKDTVILNGTTAVRNTKYFRTIHTARVLDDGNDSIGGGNMGTITMESVGGGEDMAIIGLHNGRTLMSPFTIPENYRAKLVNIYFTSGQGRAVQFKFRTYGNNGAESRSWVNRLVWDSYQNSGNIPMKLPIILEPKTSIVFTGKNLQAGNIEASIIYQLILEEVIP